MADVSHSIAQRSVDPTCPLMDWRKRLLLIYLKASRGRAVRAVELADRLMLPWTRETRRRAVRKIVARLHDDGHRICADCHPTEGGYWLARSGAEWRRYRESRAGGARFEFVRLRKMKEAATDRISGQGTLLGGCKVGSLKVES